jgi:Rhodopirellula transposase DDE domain
METRLARVICVLLHEVGYSPQAPAKTVEGCNHPDRDGQFQYLNHRLKTVLAQG